MAMPTISTTPCTRPSCRRASAKIRSTSSRRVTSAASADPPTSAATRSPRAASLSPQSTRAPHCASACAACRPMPWPAPSTTMPRPSSRNSDANAGTALVSKSVIAAPHELPQKIMGQNAASSAAADACLGALRPGGGDALWRGFEHRDQVKAETLSLVALARFQLRHRRPDVGFLGDHLDGAIDHFEAAVRELDQEATAIVGIRQAPHQLLADEAIDLLGDRAGGHQQRAKQVGRTAGERRTATAQGQQEAHVLGPHAEPAQAEPGKARLDDATNALQVDLQQEVLQVEVRPLAPPLRRKLVNQAVTTAGCHRALARIDRARMSANVRSAQQERRR